MHKHNG
nr:unnamed protein product [Callosobruchus analis]